MIPQVVENGFRDRGAINTRFHCPKHDRRSEYDSQFRRWYCPNCLSEITISDRRRSEGNDRRRGEP